MNIKYSALRQFGSEQFSMTIEADNKEVLIADAVHMLNQGITNAFDEVNRRELIEKSKLIDISKERESIISAHNTQLKSEMDTATEGKRLVQKAEYVNKKKK